MARRYNRRRNARRVRSRRRAKELTSLAYKMGQVERGKKNPGSRISESFNRGAAAPQKRKNKPLF